MNDSIPGALNIVRFVKMVKLSFEPLLGLILDGLEITEEADGYE